MRVYVSEVILILFNLNSPTSISSQFFTVSFSKLAQLLLSKKRIIDNFSLKIFFVSSPLSFSFFYSFLSLWKVIGCCFLFLEFWCSSSSFLWTLHLVPRIPVLLLLLRSVSASLQSICVCTRCASMHGQLSSFVISPVCPEKGVWINKMKILRRSCISKFLL